MSSAQHIVLSKKQLVAIGATGFGGMIAAVLATIAVMMPIMGAQATSLLDKQSQLLGTPTAQQSNQGKAVTAAAVDTGAGGPIVSCVMPSGEGGGQPSKHEPAPQPKSKAVTVSTGAKFVAKPIAKHKAPVKHAAPAPVKHHKVVHAPVITKTTIYDNDNVVIDSYNTVTIKDSFNEKDVKNVTVEPDKKDYKDKKDHKGKKDYVPSYRKTSDDHKDKKYDKKRDDHKKYDKRKDDHKKYDKKFDYRKDDYKNKPSSKHDKYDKKHDDKKFDHKKNDRYDHKDRKDHGRKDDHKKHDKHDRKDRKDHHNDKKDHERKDGGKGASYNSYRS